MHIYTYIHEHVHMQVPASAFAARWFMCAYVNVLSGRSVMRVWDCLFFDGAVRTHSPNLFTSWWGCTTSQRNLVDVFKHVEKSQRHVSCYQDKIFSLIFLWTHGLFFCEYTMCLLMYSFMMRRKCVEIVITNTHVIYKHVYTHTDMYIHMHT